MFFSLSLCAVPLRKWDCMNPSVPSGLKKIHYAAAAADIVLGVALLVIGILGTQWGFLPSGLQYAFIGAGSAYSLGIFCSIGLYINKIKPEDPDPDLQY